MRRGGGPPGLMAPPAPCGIGGPPGRGPGAPIGLGGIPPGNGGRGGPVGLICGENTLFIRSDITDEGI